MSFGDQPPPPVSSFQMNPLTTSNSLFDITGQDVLSSDAMQVEPGIGDSNSAFPTLRQSGPLPVDSGFPAAEDGSFTWFDQGVKRENPESAAPNVPGCVRTLSEEGAASAFGTTQSAKMVKVSEEERVAVDTAMTDAAQFETPKPPTAQRKLPGLGELRTCSTSIPVYPDSGMARKQTQSEIAKYSMPAARRQTQEFLQLLKHLKDVSRIVGEIRNNQQRALMVGDIETLRTVHAQEEALRKEYEDYATALNTKEHQILLTPCEIKQIRCIREELDFQMEQVMLLKNEAAQLLDPKQRECSPMCCASLILTRSPFPNLFTKGKLPDNSVRVRLVKGARQELRHESEFQTTTEALQNSRVPLQNVVDIYKIEKKSDETTELRLKIVNGSRMIPVVLKVSLPVTCPSGAVMLETLKSPPFVVITNESQYEDGNAALLRYLAFGNGSVTDWPHFANAVQEHFMRATKQAELITEDPESMTLKTDGSVPLRAISVHELEYLHERFFNNEKEVNTTQFVEFWKWFGKVIIKMRSTKQVANMWRKGLLWVFSTRKEIEQALMPYPPGTFVTRFSESNPGLFAIAYRAVDQPVRHYLVRQEEISIQKTLPDLLSEIGDLTSILRVLRNDFGDEPLPPLYVSLSKHSALQHFCSQREAVVGTGYDQTIGGSMHPPTPSSPTE